MPEKNARLMSSVGSGRFSALSAVNMLFLGLITLTVFVPFALFYLKEPLKLDFLWAGLCLVGAAYFMFRDRL